MILRRLLATLLAATTTILGTPAYAQSVLPDDFEQSEPEAEEAEEDEEDEEDDEPREPDEPVERDEPIRSQKNAGPTTKPKNRRLTSGLGFTLSVGGLSTLRRMKFAGSDHSISHRPGVYLGGVIRGEQHVWLFKKSKSHLLLDAEGGFGSAKNANVEPALGRALTTEHAYLLLLALFEKPIHPSVDLRLGLGLSALSYTVEQNPEYTGHRYLSLAANFGGAYWVSKKTKVGGNLVFLPGLSTNQSAGDYGAARSFGGRGELYLSWRFIQPEPPDLFGSAEFGARYSYARFQTTMPETQVLGDLARTADVAHSLTLFVSYNL